MSKKITTDLYLVHCLTNMHIGSGDSTYGIVDKEVQKDPIEGTPVIHASGIKGALRELLEYYDCSDIELIFGTDSKAKKEPKDFKAGQYYFMEAHLLFLPVRSSEQPFYYATSSEILKRFLKFQEQLNIEPNDTIKKGLSQMLSHEAVKEKPIIFSGSTGGSVFIDEYEAIRKEAIEFSLPAGVSGITGSNISLFHHDDLKSVCSRMPVIARNNLENGISVNLWYEEVVPRETIFYFFVSRPKDNNSFETGLNHENIKYTAQIGGNASIGYGLSKLVKV